VRKRRRVLLLAMMLTPLLAQASPLLTLSPPSGSIQASQGSVTGWGFTISNPDANFLVVTSARFCQTTSAVGHIVCIFSPDPSFGVFTDYIAQFNFIVAGPTPESPVISQAFNPALLTGIGSFAVPATAPYGTFSAGIVLDYDLYSRSPNDPAFDPVRDRINTGRENVFGAAAAVTVIPEPATFLLVACGAAMLLRRRRRC
jgi:hypothetical protein